MTVVTTAYNFYSHIACTQWIEAAIIHAKILIDIMKSINLYAEL